MRRALVVGLALAALAIARPAPARAGCLWEGAWPECDDGSTVNGYWWGTVGWVPGLPDMNSWFRRYPTLSTGAAVYYAPGVMEATARWRGLSLKGMAGAVATMTCSEIGLEVWLQPPGGAWEGPFIVADCAQRDDIWPIVKYRQEVVEVDWRTALRWGMGYGVSKIRDVKVSMVEPNRLPAGLEAVDYPSWWLAQAAFDRTDDERVYPKGGSRWFIDGVIHEYKPMPIPDVAATAAAATAEVESVKPAVAEPVLRNQGNDTRIEDVQTGEAQQEEGRMDIETLKTIITLVAVPLLPALIVQGINVFWMKGLKKPKPSVKAIRWVCYIAAIVVTVPQMLPVLPALPPAGAEPAAIAAAYAAILTAVIAWGAAVSTAAQVYYDKFLQPVLGGIDSILGLADKTIRGTAGFLAPARGEA